MLNKLALLFVGALLTAQAHAQTLQLGEPSYGGTGCPDRSASVTLNNNNSEMSILFDSYVVEAGNGRRLDRKNCGIAIPVRVPQGFSVAVFKVDYRGFNAIPSGGYSRLTAEYFWAGSRGPTISRIFNGPINQNFTVTDELEATTLVWSACGADVILRANTTAMVQTNSRQDQAMSTVDSADVSSGLIYHLQWKRCR